MARKRVLVVEEEAESRAPIRDSVKTAGSKPAKAGDGPEGLAKAFGVTVGGLLE